MLLWGFGLFWVFLSFVLFLAFFYYYHSIEIKVLVKRTQCISLSKNGQLKAKMDGTVCSEGCDTEWQDIESSGLLACVAKQLYLLARFLFILSFKGYPVIAGDIETHTTLFS